LEGLNRFRLASRRALFFPVSVFPRAFSRRRCPISVFFAEVFHDPFFAVP